MAKEISLTDKITKKIKKIILIILLLIIIFIICIIFFFFNSLRAVDKKDNESIIFTVNQGDTAYQDITNLKKENLIRNELSAKLFYKLADGKEFMAGKYSISKNLDVETIFTTLSDGTKAIVDSISVTFVEGKRVNYFAEKISDNFGYEKEEVLKVMNNKEFINSLIDKYWFLTDDILNESIYYPLEGYLYPDTYSFMKDASVEEIIEKLVSSLGAKLEPYKEQIATSGKSIHSLLTMASMVELEAVTAEDRLMVAGVFYNRLSKNMSMGSDVTTYYAVKKEMKDSLTLSDLSLCNAYNTRGSCANFPIGPIANSSMSSIEAAINPENSDYLYFVADKNNKVYFSKTDAEQQVVIRDLKNKNLWPE